MDYYIVRYPSGQCISVWAMNEEVAKVEAVEMMVRDRGILWYIADHHLEVTVIPKEPTLLGTLS